MKTLKWLCMLAMLPILWACSNTEEEPEITVPAGNEDYFLKNMDFDSGAGTKTFTFSTNGDWAISLAPTRSGTNWATVSPMSGKRGVNTITVTVAANTEYDDRSVALTLTTGTLSKNVTINQAQMDALILVSEHARQVEAAGDTIHIQVNTNVDFEVQMPTDCTWLHQLNSGSRGLAGHTIAIQVDANDTEASREAVVVIVNRNNPSQKETVTIAQAEYDGGCPDEHQPDAIDLGLPSGTKWANCNVGASKPEEYGGYYAWGETSEKSDYSVSGYLYYENGNYVNIGSDIAGTQYDVAHVRMGGSWRMPSLDQIKELLNNCTQAWTQRNGVNGILVTGPNGGQIFLPAAGYRWSDFLDCEGSCGGYWSSMLYPGYSIGACYLGFTSGQWFWLNRSREYGQSVRAVCP